ncbi:MAG: type II toxin-antitoxin system RelB/DinJ family antitoxin [Candidatus Gastranaerophilales bacterium]|nr:type II toxin-antitoxin system RelB/DinJ family antitoxin [Candidatus Gastranaerophilales bacterium]
MITAISIRIDSKLKNKAGKTLSAIGLDMSSAVKIFLNQVVTEKGLPFTPSVRSASEIRAEWDKSINEALKSGKKYKNSDDLIKDLMK